MRLWVGGPGGFEPPTSTMSKPIGRTKTHEDTEKPMETAVWATGIDLDRLYRWLSRRTVTMTCEA